MEKFEELLILNKQKIIGDSTCVWDWKERELLDLIKIEFKPRIHKKYVDKGYNGCHLNCEKSLISKDEFKKLGYKDEDKEKFQFFRTLLLLNKGCTLESENLRRKCPSKILENDNSIDSNAESPPPENSPVPMGMKNKQQ
eukprot:UN01075